MQVTIEAGAAKGIVSAPPSKSMAHRLLICAAMAEGASVVRGISSCEDVSATLDCLRALGVKWEQTGDTVQVFGIDPRKSAPAQPLCCRESGSTLRFFIPIALLSGNPTVLQGAPALMKRPMDVYEKICLEKGLQFTKNGQEIAVQGPLPSGEYTVVGNVSSQFISGLLFALPLSSGDSIIRILPPLESRSYLDLTVSALRRFGVEVKWQDDLTISIAGGQRYIPRDTVVEGDYSNAAFLEALNAVGGEVTVTGLSEESLQGDRVFRQHFDALCKGRAEIHIGDCPDLGPILFSLAAAKHGGVFHGTRRLRIKESDRAATMAAELAKFGTSVTVEEDTVTVDPVSFHAPVCDTEGHNDHRVVMSMAVLLTLTGGRINGAEAVTKSYPDFFQTLHRLGLEVSEA